jgi:Protein of unknown function (DUF3224)
MPPTVVDGRRDMHLSLTRLAMIGTAALSLALLAAAPSGADSSIAVAGTVTPTSATFNERAADGNIIVDAVGTHAWTGDLSGTSTIDVHFVIHSDGQVTYEGHLTFTGSTPCGTGTMYLEDQGRGTFPGPLPGNFTAVDQGSSTLAIHAKGSNVLFLGPAGAFGTFSGEVSCG